MSLTAIRIEERLKARLISAAEHAGMTTQAFILETIERAVEQSELKAEFNRVADERWANLLKAGESVPWHDANAYVSARARGEHPRKPVARQLKQRP